MRLQLVRRMKIPPGEAPRHFECGHALHADCYTIYVCSAGHACPICALDGRLTSPDRGNVDSFEYEPQSSEIGAHAQRPRTRRFLRHRRRQEQSLLSEAESARTDANVSSWQQSTHIIASLDEGAAMTAREDGPSVELSPVDNENDGRSAHETGGAGTADGHLRGSGDERLEHDVSKANQQASPRGEMNGTRSGLPSRGTGMEHELSRERGLSGSGEGDRSSEDDTLELQEPASDAEAASDAEIDEHEEQELVMALQVSLAEYHESSCSASLRESVN